LIGDSQMMIEEEEISNHYYNNNNKRFTIQYTKEELNKITFDFVTQMDMYIARVTIELSRLLMR